MNTVNEYLWVMSTKIFYTCMLTERLRWYYDYRYQSIRTYRYLYLIYLNLN